MRPDEVEVRDVWVLVSGLAFLAQQEFGQMYTSQWKSGSYSGKNLFAVGRKGSASSYSHTHSDTYTHYSSSNRYSYPNCYTHTYKCPHSYCSSNSYPNPYPSANTDTDSSLYPNYYQCGGESLYSRFQL